MVQAYQFIDLKIYLPKIFISFKNQSVSEAVIMYNTSFQFHKILKVYQRKDSINTAPANICNMNTSS